MNFGVLESSFSELHQFGVQVFVLEVCARVSAEVFEGSTYVIGQHAFPMEKQTALAVPEEKKGMTAAWQTLRNLSLKPQNPQAPAPCSSGPTLHPTCLARCGIPRKAMTSPGQCSFAEISLKFSRSVQWRFSSLKH